MLRIDLKRLGKNHEVALDYLRSHLTESPRLRGDHVELASTRAREAKTVLHKFLHHAGLEGYRVAVINSGLIEIHELDVQEKHPVKKGGGAAPSAWETVPGQSWLKPSALARPGKRSKRQIRREIRGLS
jgi:hypothetical protein